MQTEGKSDHRRTRHQPQDKVCVARTVVRDYRTSGGAMRSWAALALALIAAAHARVHASSLPADVSSATVHMEIQDNRIFVPLQVSGPNGAPRTALFWVDSGGDTVFLSGPLAGQLGLEKNGASFVGMGYTPSHAIATPHLAMGGMNVDVSGVSASASESASRDVFAGIAADGFLPAAVLKKYDVIIDYPARHFTLSKSGPRPHRGISVPMTVNPATGFARVEVNVAGKLYGFMLDTGAAYTGVSLRLMHQWADENPTWPHSNGAVGAANMVGKSFDDTNELMRLPEISWGSYRLRNVGVVSRPDGVYENAVSRDMTAPIVGALAGNVLRQFRLELDYPAGVAYLDRQVSRPSSDLNSVGLIVQIKDNGAVMISGVVERKGLPEVAGIQPGDQLLQVNKRMVTGAPLATVLELLSGRTGQEKHLTVQRGSKRLSVSATVYSHP